MAQFPTETLVVVSPQLLIHPNQPSTAEQRSSNSNYFKTSNEIKYWYF